MGGRFFWCIIFAFGYIVYIFTEVTRESIRLCEQKKGSIISTPISRHHQRTPLHVRAVRFASCLCPESFVFVGYMQIVHKVSNMRLRLTIILWALFQSKSGCKSSFEVEIKLKLPSAESCPIIQNYSHFIYCQK